jgi:hypothetical protein
MSDSKKRSHDRSRKTRNFLTTTIRNTLFFLLATLVPRTQTHLNEIPQEENIDDSRFYGGHIRHQQPADVA